MSKNTMLRNRARHHRDLHRRDPRLVRVAVETLERRQLLANSIYAYPGADGHFLYKPLPLGDHVQDYSTVGYRGGTAPIPTVAVPAISFTVANASGFAVGDTVIVHRPSTQQWINDMGMNLLTNPWTPGSKDINMDRTITHIDGNVITIDAPITQALDLKYTDASQRTNTIHKYTDDRR